MRVGVVTFPGSLDDVDAQRAVRDRRARGRSRSGTATTTCGASTRSCCPGGFSYGDYLRCGAISRFAPVMTEVVEAAGRGMPVLGICNGFQILCESHLLPGALIRNDHRKFVCRDQRLRIENNRTAWTSAYAEGAEVTIVLKNGEGGFVADEPTPSTGSRARAGSSPATSTATPTARCATSPASPTSAATSSA